MRVFIILAILVILFPALLKVGLYILLFLLALSIILYFVLKKYWESFPQIYFNLLHKQNQQNMEDVFNHQINPNQYSQYQNRAEPEGDVIDVKAERR